MLLRNTSSPRVYWSGELVYNHTPCRERVKILKTETSTNDVKEKQPLTIENTSIPKCAHPRCHAYNMSDVCSRLVMCIEYMIGIQLLSSY